MPGKYDFLVVGAGLFGATFAQAAREKGKRSLVIDRRRHIAGNAYTEETGGIHVHMYGPHVFRTNSKAVWDYVNRFAEFNHFVNSPLARTGDALYNLPFNMNTFHQLWGVTTPAEAKSKIESQKLNIPNPQNLEEQALSLVGRDIYEKFIKGYTEKQWGRQCRDLPASIIRRLPLRFTFDNNYFNDRYQGIPVGGYTRMVEKMLGGCDVLLGTDYFDFVRKNRDAAPAMVYTGPIDEFFGYRFGPLGYRSLRFETETVLTDSFQGNAVVNYTSYDVPYTRIIEHKHFEFGTQDITVITREYPAAWEIGLEPYYPINDGPNNMLYSKYKELAAGLEDVHFGGRLGGYAYLDMEQVVGSALGLSGKILD